VRLKFHVVGPPFFVACTSPDDPHPSQLQERDAEADESGCETSPASGSEACHQYFGRFGSEGGMRSIVVRGHCSGYARNHGQADRGADLSSSLILGGRLRRRIGGDVAYPGGNIEDTAGEGLRVVCEGGADLKVSDRIHRVRAD
jgi:hypothetical protein